MKENRAPKENESCQRRNPAFKQGRQLQIKNYVGQLDE